jgi:hypothetical protein
VQHFALRHRPIPQNLLRCTKVTASTCAFSVPFALTYQSKNHRVSFHLWSQQQANEILRLDLPKFDLTDHELPRCTYNGGYIDCG